MQYVITINLFNVRTGNSSIEKRFTDEEHLEKCIDNSVSYARKEASAFGCSCEIYLNKCYMCFDGYLYTGDYIRRIL